MLIYGIYGNLSQKYCPKISIFAQFWKPQLTTLSKTERFRAIMETSAQERTSRVS